MSEKKPSESSEIVNQSTESIVRPRERSMTDKGRDYQISLRENHFKTAISSWRRLSNKTSVLLSDCKDVDSSRNQRDLLQYSLEELDTKYQQLMEVKDNVSVENEKLENIEVEHQRIMQMVSAKIVEIENEEFVTKSTVSNRSKSSKSSHRSKGSNISKLSNAAVRQITQIKHCKTNTRPKTEPSKYLQLVHFDDKVKLNLFSY